MFDVSSFSVKTKKHWFDTDLSIRCKVSALLERKKGVRAKTFIGYCRGGFTDIVLEGTSGPWVRYEPVIRIVGAGDTAFELEKIDDFVVVVVDGVKSHLYKTPFSPKIFLERPLSSPLVFVKAIKNVSISRSVDSGGFPSSEILPALVIQCHVDRFDYEIYGIWDGSGVGYMRGPCGVFMEFKFNLYDAQSLFESGIRAVDEFLKQEWLCPVADYVPIRKIHETGGTRC